MIRQPLALNVLEQELDEGVSFCRQEGLGVELTSFAFPYGRTVDFEKQIERHAAAVEQVAWVSLHGPFLDLYVTSPDPEIVTLCQRRHRVALKAARQIGAIRYVAHLNSIPLIRNVSYRDRFARAAADFWLPFADEAGKHGITIVLENLWEPGPELHKRVIEQANHPHLKASFDNGHALVFSERPASDWIEVLGSDLGHCHLHDNDGTYDQHLAVGAGTEDWPSLLKALEAHSEEAVVVLESDYLEKNKVSLSALRGLSKR